MVYDVIPVGAAGTRLQIRRGVDVADAQARQIGSESGGIPETEPLVELQAVGRPRDRRCAGLRHVSFVSAGVGAPRSARKISAISMKRGRAASSSKVIDRRRRQFGCSSEVAGTFTGSASSVRSSICAIARTDGVRARKTCAARAKVGMSGSPIVRQQPLAAERLQKLHPIALARLDAGARLRLAPGKGRAVPSDRGRALPTSRARSAGRGCR